MKFWCISNHVTIDSRQSGNEIGNLTFGIHQGSKFIDDVRAVEFKNADFGNLIALDPVSGSFYVNDAVGDRFTFFRF